MIESKPNQEVDKPQRMRLKAMHNLKVREVLGKNVLIRTAEPWTDMDEVQKKGLLYIPQSVQEQNKPMPTTGIVVRLGNDLLPDGECILQPGDMVMFSKYAGVDFQVQKDDYRLIAIDQILCVFELTEVAEVTEDLRPTGSLT